MAMQIIEEDALFGSSSLSQQLPLLSLNHVSFTCRSVSTSVKFYNDVLGFVRIRRPSSFDFEGAWLFSHGIGIHLLEVETTPTKTESEHGIFNAILRGHLDFTSDPWPSISHHAKDLVKKMLTPDPKHRLTAHQVLLVEEGGVEVDQLFFHDPDGYMIEICNCHVLPVLPITSCPLKKLTPIPQINQGESSFYDKIRSKNYFCGEDEVLIMENLLIDIMGIVGLNNTDSYI